jgi:murein DD-endopeptidase MepM/ murein hydrolase activator NlpD
VSVRAVAAAATLAGAAVTSMRIRRAADGRPPSPADVIVVLGCGGAELIARVEAAVDLHRRSLAPVILCSGTAPEVDAMRRELLTRDVAPDAIVTDATATSTRTALHGVARRAAGRRALLVSSPYHLHRLSAEAARRGLDACPVPAAFRSAGVRRYVREILAVWWYALPFRMSTIETRMVARAAAASAELRAIVARANGSPGGIGASLLLPVDAPVTSGFGWRRTRLHEGVDFAADTGTPVRCAADGTVVHTGSLDVYGTVVAVAHADGLATVYAHLSAALVAPGQALAAGDLVGRVGASGNAFGPHLHFELRLHGDPIDPLSHISLERELPLRRRPVGMPAALAYVARGRVVRGLRLGRSRGTPTPAA